ncbi:ankyrin repeat-containing protein [Treponema sp. JC4]|uniref:ankyrin repeat domain-containing protein n=1 Tax=Treponema sp. JC4 TaxID=1124982 RepID=UPI00025B0BBA|nr:ankyrin repeat domain-containing protein [Treponema sp. JC4]EID85930.1 ankyrin repeat-containing protein [Treponema sp. JC4]
MTKKILFAVSILCFGFVACTTSQVAPKADKDSIFKLLKQNKYDEVRSRFQYADDINGVDEEGNTVLHLAAAANEADLTLYLLIKGADPELKNYNGDTPLSLAIKSGAVESAETIVNQNQDCIFARDGNGQMALDLALNTSPAYYGIMINEKTGAAKDSDDNTIVHHFVMSKNVRGIEVATALKLPIDQKNAAGKTPLELAYLNLTDDDSVTCAADLILGGAETNNEEYAYFETAVSDRNLDERFDDGQTPLHIAAIQNHVAIEKYLLVNDADNSAQDSSGASPLHEAVRYGNLDIIKALLDSGANVNSKDNLGKTPIMVITPKDRTQEIYTLLISYRADLNEKDMFGDTVLHNAIMVNSDVEVVSILTNNGADVNVRNKEGVTPLHIAVQKDQVGTAHLLTENGANIHTMDAKGKSPLALALEGSQAMLEAVVTQKNAMTQDSDGNTPLHVALLKDAPLSKVQYIVSLTDNVNLRNRDGNSALFLAVIKNRQKVGELLLAKNADIFSTNTNNNSPLRLALRYPKIQEWLITSKTIRATDGSGNTVLHYAAEWQFTDSVKSLTSKGADISATNSSGENCLFSAARTNNPAVVQVVVDCGADIYDRDNLGSTPVHVAVRWDAPDSIDKLVLLGANVNAQNSSGKTPLAEAVVSGKYLIVRKLLESGANPNVGDTNGVTPLIDAIRINNKDMVKLLLVHNANPNLQQVNGQNAFHEAAILGDKEIITLIRNVGGNPLARDKKDNTPFSIVMNTNPALIRDVLGNSYTITDSDGNSPINIVVKSRKSVALLQTLIDYGYPIDTKDSDGYTALNYAIEHKYYNTATVLLQNGADPFLMIDKKGRNGVTIALESKDTKILNTIAKYAGTLCDIQGNTILHYAAKTSDEEIVKLLISYGLDKKIANISGDTPYDLAVRWKRPEIANILDIE